MKFRIHIDIDTRVLTRSSPGDCQIPFYISQGFAEVQIVKKVKIAQNLSIDKI